MKDWLDSTGSFIFGKHQGELAEDVATKDPSYIRWIVYEVEDVSDEDRDILSFHLNGSGRKAAR